MASKPKSKPANKKPAVTRSPATSAPATSATTKERKPRKPPLERAIRLGGLLAKQMPALQKNVSLWKGEPNSEQRMACVRILGNLKKISPTVEQLVSDLAFLNQSGYAPKIEHLGGRAKSFPVGAYVAIKEKRYDTAVHGLDNLYVIEGETEKYLQIQALATGSPVIGVPRAWLEKAEAPVSADEVDDDNANPGSAVEG